MLQRANGTDGRTDGRTPYRFIDRARSAHTTRTVSIIRYRHTSLNDGVDGDVGWVQLMQLLRLMEMVTARLIISTDDWSVSSDQLVWLGVDMYTAIYRST